MPMGTHLFLFMLLGLGFYLISALAAKLIPAIDFWIDIVLWVGAAVYIFSHLSFMDGIVSIATMFYCYWTAMDLIVSERAENLRETGRRSSWPETKHASCQTLH